MDQQRLHLKSVAAPLVTVALFPVHLWCQEGLEEEEEGEGFRASLLLVLSMKTLCQALSGSHSQVCDTSSLSVASATDAVGTNPLWPGVPVTVTKLTPKQTLPSVPL